MIRFALPFTVAALAPISAMAHHSGPAHEHLTAFWGLAVFAVVLGVAALMRMMRQR